MCVHVSKGALCHVVSCGQSYTSLYSIKDSLIKVDQLAEWPQVQKDGKVFFSL